MAANNSFYKPIMDAKTAQLRAELAAQAEQRKLAATVSPYLQLATDTGPFSDEVGQ